MKWKNCPTALFGLTLKRRLNIHGTWEMCMAYARAVKDQIEADGQFEAAVTEAREAYN